MKTLLISNGSGSLPFICKKLQESWEIQVQEDSRKLAKEKEYHFTEPNDDFKIILSRPEYEQFDFKRFKPDNIFIVPELLWDRDGVSEGYGIANDIIVQKLTDAFFQLSFISILNRKDILHHVEKRYYNLVRVFPHFCLLDPDEPVTFKNYTRSHFYLIKYLALSDEGRIDLMKHEIAGIKSNIKDKEESELCSDKSRLEKQLNELALLRAWSGEKLSEEQQKVTDADSGGKLKSVISEIESEIEKIKSGITGQREEDNPGKTNYQVLIIEDDKVVREFLVKTFSALYTRVDPDIKNSGSFDIRKTNTIVTEYAKEAQIIILDLLFEDENQCWLNFNGLDLYEKIKTRINRDAAVRIITHLPREIVARVIEQTLQIKIPVSHVFTKKAGLEALGVNITRRSEEINRECKENERRKTVYKPFPKEGIFKGAGIQELLSRLLSEEREVLDDAMRKANDFFQRFLSNGFIDTDEWKNGELPSPRMVKKIRESYFLEKLPNILAHRKLALYQLHQGRNPGRIVYNEYLEEILKRVSKMRKLDKGYFYTKLGFTGKEDESKEAYAPEERNLFPEEIVFVADLIREKEERADETPDQYPVLMNWFIEVVLCDLDVWDSWIELELKYDPYQSEMIEERGHPEPGDFEPVSLSDIAEFFKALVTHYRKDMVSKIIDQVITNNPLPTKGESEIRDLKNVRFLYESILDLQT